MLHSLQLTYSHEDPNMIEYSLIKSHQVASVTPLNLGQLPRKVFYLELCLHEKEKTWEIQIANDDARNAGFGHKRISGLPGTNLVFDKEVRPTAKTLY